MTLALVAIGAIVVAFFIGIFVGCRATRARHPARQPASMTELTDTFRDLVQKVEHQLVRHGKSLANDVTELVTADSPSTYTKVIWRLIDSHKAFTGEIQEFADGARRLQNEVVRSIVEEELSLPVDPTKKPELAGDRRKEDRHPYLCKQWIAPYSGDRLPDLEEFCLVQCRDLSSGGISFFVDDLPEHDTFVVRLHGLQGAKYLTVRVQQTTRSTNHEYGRYVVGCQFLGTLHASALPSEFERIPNEQPELLPA